MPSKAVILKLFTKELILNSVPGLKEKLGQPKKMVLEAPGKKVFEVSALHKLAETPAAATPMPPEFVKPGIKVLAPPALRPPAPVYTAKPAGIDFGKLLSLIQNPSITTIECPGPNKEVIIRTYNVRKPYPITLSNQEMLSIVEQFAKKAKVPLIDGLFRAWVDRFLISAIVSNKQIQNFIIQKVIYPHFV